MKTKIILAMHTWANTFARYMRNAEGLEITTARNSNEVLELLGKDPSFEAIVIEVLLPLPTGYRESCYMGGGDALCEELRKRGFKGVIVFWGGADLITQSVFDQLGEKTRTYRFDINDEGGSSPEGLGKTILKLLGK